MPSLVSKSPRILSADVSRDIAMRGDAGGSWFGASPTLTLHAPASPSSGVVARSNRAQRDRHGMPVYSTSERVRLVRTTAYHPAESDHLQYGCMSAAGTQLQFTNRVRSAAADWSVYPVGTVFRISGLPYLYVVDDYGSALTGNATVDIYEPTKDLMNVWGSRNVEMTILQWGSFNRSAEILSKRTSYGHCRQMLANIIRQRPDLGRVAKN